MALVRQSASALATGDGESIAERLLEQMLFRHARRASPSEMRSWDRSVPVLAHELVQAGLGSVEIMLEHQLPLTSKRVDAVLAGYHPRTGRAVVRRRRAQAVERRPPVRGAARARRGRRRTGTDPCCTRRRRCRATASTCSTSSRAWPTSPTRSAASRSCTTRRLTGSSRLWELPDAEVRPDDHRRPTLGAARVPPQPARPFPTGDEGRRRARGDARRPQPAAARRRRRGDQEPRAVHPHRRAARGLPRRPARGRAGAPGRPQAGDHRERGTRARARA